MVGSNEIENPLSVRSWRPGVSGRTTLVSGCAGVVPPQVVNNEHRLESTTAMSDLVAPRAVDP
jgi:hypothetical protein